MRNRNIHIQFWLNKKEAEALNKRVKKSGLSRESYLRQLINNLLPTDKPPPDYYNMMRQLHAIGNTLDQIARHAKAVGAIDTARFDEAAAALNEAIVTIVEAVMLPRKLR